VSAVWALVLTLLGAGGRADTTRYAGGRVAAIRHYDARGRAAGTHRGWWENGAPKFAYTYAGGVMEGRAVDWFRDGRPYREAHYARGHEDGPQRMWYADGTLRASYVVRDGRRYGLMGAKGCVTRDDSTRTGP
jgi:antitoxin component YwqK of YwqJK toxin-antitoxin module